MNIASLTADFAKVMEYPDNREELFVFDFTKGYQPDQVAGKGWGIGRYNEKRQGMYDAPQYNGRRNIHMGIDIWAKAGSEVFSFYKGVVAYQRDNNREGDYGPTIVIKYDIGGTILFALYGHLSRPTMERFRKGEVVGKGEKLGEIGTTEVNGGWVPHLHFQLSVEDPKVADMPGVVSDEDHNQALQKYPDPRMVLGDLY